jgi:hypothetical protein
MQELAAPISALNTRVGNLTGGLDLKLLLPLTLLYLGLRRGLVEGRTAPASYPAAGDQGPG